MPKPNEIIEVHRYMCGFPGQDCRIPQEIHQKGVPRWRAQVIVDGVPVWHGPYCDTEADAWESVKDRGKDLGLWVARDAHGVAIDPQDHETQAYSWDRTPVGLTQIQDRVATVGQDSHGSWVWRRRVDGHLFREPFKFSTPEEAREAADTQLLRDGWKLLEG